MAYWTMYLPVYNLVYFTSGTIKKLSTPKFRYQPPTMLVLVSHKNIATLSGGPIFERSNSLC